MTDLDGVTRHEICRTEYYNGRFGAGTIAGHPQDDIYLEVQSDRAGDKFTTIIGLNRGEALDIIRLLATVLYELEGE